MTANRPTKPTSRAIGRPRPEKAGPTLASAPTRECDAAVEVDGAQLLDEAHAAIKRYVILPSDHAATAVVLWIAASHGIPAWNAAPRLVIKAPEKRCGKSRLLDLVEALAHRPLMTTNASPSAVYRSIGLSANDPPTLLIDEADAIFGPKAADHEDLRGLLNAGHQRGRPALRYDAGRRAVDRIETFAMAALAGIGHMPDTIEDRAVIIKMRRRAPDETVMPYRARRDGPALADLRTRLNQWVRANLTLLTDTVPEMPVEDRAADTWEPLIALADLAGHRWPDTARQAAVALVNDEESADNVSLRVRLLMDTRDAFRDADALPTADLLNRLREDQEAPWATYGPAGLTAMRLGLMLRDFDITSHNVRFVSGQAKGFLRVDFTDAWGRYCPTRPGPRTSPQREPRAKPSQPSQPLHRRSAPGRLEAWDGLSRPTDPSRPGADLHGDGWDGWDGCPTTTETTPAGTSPGGATATSSTAVCITCREPLSHDDGTHTHPTCTTA